MSALTLVMVDGSSCTVVKAAPGEMCSEHVLVQAEASEVPAAGPTPAVGTSWCGACLWDVASHFVG